MGTQKTIAKEIHEADAQYVLALKGNHERVQQEVKDFFCDARERKVLKGCHTAFWKPSKSTHGRIETRRYWITEEIRWFADCTQWEGLRSFGMVESTREIQETRLPKSAFSCSIKADAAEFARAVRGHWGIENQLHWSLDVAFGEDQCRARVGHASENLARLRHIALNILKPTRPKNGHQGKTEKCRLGPLLSPPLTQYLDAIALPDHPA